MRRRLTKKDIEQINAIINSYGLVEEDFTNREKMEAACIRLQADLIRIGLSPDCLISDRFRKKRKPHAPNLQGGN
ncbi:MAG: hypothetical protein WC357_02870 [Candidatus Omnitrophota bacterium]|jgi:hypothetical protein